jgi:hypothetical protein
VSLFLLTMQRFGYHVPLFPSHPIAADSGLSGSAGEKPVWTDCRRKCTGGSTASIGITARHECCLRSFFVSAPLVSFSAHTASSSLLLMLPAQQNLKH